jgi:hypothetical protein
MRHLNSRTRFASRSRRPLQGLVARHQEPGLGIGEQTDDVALLRVVGNGAARAGVGLPLAGRDEPQEEAPRRVLLRRRQAFIGVFSRLLDRGRDAPDLRVTLAGVLWAFWFKLGAPDFLTVDKRDTEHANLNYVITIICLPLQSLLLLIAGLYGWRTLRQNHEFKQRDVEQQCVTDYMAVQKQIQDAGNDQKKVEAAIRAYWVLMVYEFYWWRRGLISRRLFLSWAEFREKEFRRNLSYFHPAPTPPTGAAAPTPRPFENFIQGFTYCQDHNVIRKGTDFVRFMNYLHDRSRGPERPLYWFHIERFRHRSLGGWVLGRP